MLKLKRVHIYIFLISTAVLIFSGCGKPVPVTIPDMPNAATSLLLVTPLIGDEKTPAETIPDQIRLTINDESVIGWTNPDGKALSFPIVIRDGAHLSFLLGAVSESELSPGNLDAVVTYHRVDNDSIPDKDGIELYRKSESGLTEWTSNWESIDINLTNHAPSNGLIVFEIEGSKAGDDDTTLLWGQPAIYHPFELTGKNVLLIGIDTLRADGLAIYGGREDVSPNLTALAESGMVFNRAWSQAPFTVPSFASMLTGRYPADIAPTLQTENLPVSATTISEILIPLGYSTSMVCGNAYIGNEQSGFDQGMESNWFVHNADPTETVNQAIAVIERQDGRNWFMFLHFMDPHGPYDPPQEYVDRICSPFYNGPYQTAFEDGLEWQLATEIPPEDEIRRVRELYDTEIADLDDQIGELFDFLESSGYLEDTLVIFAADHGEEFYEHGMFEHGQSLYDEMVHLPLIVWGDGFDPGRTDITVQNLDIVPTIFEHLDIPLSDVYPGEPLQRIANGQISTNRTIFGEGNLRRSTHCKFAVEWPHKLILDYFTGEAQLYNLENDPFEYLDISSENTEIVQDLSGRTTLEMLPVQVTFIVTFLGNPTDAPGNLTGEIKIPGGAAFVLDSGFMSNDSFTHDGENISFEVGIEVDIENPLKALIIFPVPGNESMEISVLADGDTPVNRFYPYGDSTPEPEGSASVRAGDMPWPARIPADAQDRPFGVYVIGIPGFPRDYSISTVMEPVDLDPQTRDLLRSLGYTQ